MQFEKIGRGTLSEEIQKRIESEIVNNNLEPGSKLPTEAELSEIFGVSRASVREAIRILDAKGLVRIIKGRGIYVSELTSEPMLDAMRTFMTRQFDDKWALDIMKVRLLNEPECARNAAIDPSDADLEELGDIINGFESCEPNDFETLGILEKRFHLQIAIMSNNPVIPLLMQPIFESMPSIKAHIYEEIHLPEDTPYIKHRHIYEKIRGRKPDAAYESMVQHLEDAIEEAKGILDQR
jgi:GntR family transcriptional repressor for pyruvate dehydrogenase complex